MDLNELKMIFKNDAYAQQCGIHIDEAGEGKAVCHFDIASNHLNGRKTVQGGAIFTLADFAFAVATYANNKPAVSLENNISFMHTTKGSQLIAKAYEVSSTRKLCFYQIDIFDDLDVLVARMSVTGYKMEK